MLSEEIILNEVRFRGSPSINITLLSCSTLTVCSPSYLVGLFDEIFVFPTNKTCDPPKSATQKCQIFRYRNIYSFVFLLNITIFGCYLVLNVGKLGSYIYFLAKPPTTSILYCVYPSICRIYTVTLSAQIASTIQRKHKRFKKYVYCNMIQIVIHIFREEPKKKFIIFKQFCFLCNTGLSLD